MNGPVFHQLSGPLKTIIGKMIPYGESHGAISDLLKETFDASGAAIAEKTSQMLALVGVFAAPIVIILVVFFSKIAYDIFTGTADSIGDALLIARYKIKIYLKLIFSKIRSLISQSA